MNKHKVILDTDIGIDDAMALLFLHYSPHVELVAITTVAGNASLDNVTRNAHYVRRRFLHDANPVPIYVGAAHPMGPSVMAPDQFPDFVHGRDGLGGVREADDNWQDDDVSMDNNTTLLTSAAPSKTAQTMNSIA